MRRQLRTLREIATRSAHSKSARGACEHAATALAENPADVPFSLIYLLLDETRVELAASTGFDATSDPARPGMIDLRDGDQAHVWSLPSVVS